MKRESNKLYFGSIDDTFCSPLEDRLEDAREEGLTEITLVEAIPDMNNPDFIWCMHYGEVTDRSECRKSQCTDYESKSGRGKCANRGNLYRHGEEATFQIPSIKL